MVALFIVCWLVVVVVVVSRQLSCGEKSEKDTGFTLEPLGSRHAARYKWRILGVK